MSIEVLLFEHLEINWFNSMELIVANQSLDVKETFESIENHDFQSLKKLFMQEKGRLIFYLNDHSKLYDYVFQIHTLVTILKDEKLFIMQ